MAADITDMTTRRGLKDKYANFETIYQKLDMAYQRNPNNERVKGAIVGIYAKMCVEPLLRDKLLAKGTHEANRVKSVFQLKVYA